MKGQSGFSLIRDVKYMPPVKYISNATSDIKVFLVVPKCIYRVQVFHEFNRTKTFIFFQLVVLALAIILLSVISQPYLLLGAIPVVIIFVLLRQYYVKTAREIKRIESLSKCFCAGISCCYYETRNYKLLFKTVSYKRI